jgi:hypothetical protein
MIKKEINKDLSATENSYHKLSIQVSLNGLSFCILDTIANELSLSHSLPFKREVSPFDLHREIRQSFRDEGVLDFSFSEVIAIHRNALFSLVPQPLFDEEQLPNYLKYNAKILASDHLAYDVIKGLETVNVYVPFTNVNNFLFDLFGEFEYKHSGTVLLETLIKLPSSRQGSICYLHLAESQMDLAVFVSKKLVFYNSFYISGPEDVLYFLLFSLEQLNLDMDSLKLRLLGEVTEEDRVYEFCTEYFENVSLFVPSDSSLPLPGQEEGIDFTLINAL